MQWNQLKLKQASVNKTIHLFAYIALHMTDQEAAHKAASCKSVQFYRHKYL